LHDCSFGYGHRGPNCTAPTLTEVTWLYVMFTRAPRVIPTFTGITTVWFANGPKATPATVIVVAVAPTIA
jgi:hypothetical protein